LTVVILGFVVDLGYDLAGVSSPDLELGLLVLRAEDVWKSFVGFFLIRI